MKKILLWLLAFLITVFVLVFQRLTGPTYPIKDSVELAGNEISYTLERSHVTTEDYLIQINAPENITGTVLYKRYKTGDPWTEIPLQRKDEILNGRLPAQPPAGKLMYKVYLQSGESRISLSGDDPVIIRFKGKVPDVVVMLHVIAIFMAFLLSTRAGLEALRKEGRPRKLAYWTVAFLILGGFVLGPIMQKYAFDAFWTGFPIGSDLTDTKTMVALVGWVAALIRGRKSQVSRRWYLAAAILLLAVFLIPHSLMGSELDYTDLDQETGITSASRYDSPSFSILPNPQRAEREMALISREWHPRQMQTG
jgi:hypothetical protein